MNERDLWWKITIVGGLIALAIAAVWPMNEKIKYGIDLYGGYSLLYEIDDTGLTGLDRMKLSENVMKVLRERVDPKGVFNLVWRPVGHNRLEIQMPRPSDKVREARQKLELLQEEIRGTVLRRSDILRALAKTGTERESALAEISRGIELRKPLIQETAKAYDAHAQMKADYEVRIKQVEADNLSEADVLAAIKKPAKERSSTFETLLRGQPSRLALLQTAAEAYDAYQASSAAAQPDAAQLAAIDAKKKTLDDAVAAVLASNVDVNAQADGPTINKVVALDEALDGKIGELLATNLDIGRLQVVLDTKAGDAFRQDELNKLATKYPDLKSIIDGLVKANDALRQTRRGEGRLEDPADLQRLLRGSGVLEFRILPEISSDPTQFEKYREELTSRGPRPKPGEDQYQWFEIEDPLDFMKVANREELDRNFDSIKRRSGLVIDRFGDKYYVLTHISEGNILTHRPGEDWVLKSAGFTRDQNGRPAISFRLDERGGSKFALLTSANLKRQLCIFLDDRAVSSAMIQSRIRTDGQITGSFTPQEVQEMVKKLNAGSLPRKLKDPPISIRSIGPSLGEANRSAGLTAAKYGAICVSVFMVGYYFYAGTIAVIAVAINTLFTLAVMAAMGATLTLPGIAGLVLAVGMGVDANVLINERIREELSRGTALRMAIRMGYERAFSAILDSNVTTIITCLVLYLLGSEEIKGFGLTLGIGVFINIFTAYFITRMFFELMSLVSVPAEVVKHPITAAVIITAIGGGLFGLGYVWNQPALRDQSVLMAFGQAIMYFGPCILGLYLSMWLARWIHAAVQSGGKPRIPMLHLIPSPKFDWIGTRYFLYTFSITLTILSLLLIWKTDRTELYDIEFLGGTSATIDLKADGPIAKLPDSIKQQTEILGRLQKSAKELQGLGEAVTKATVTSNAPDTFEIRTPGVQALDLDPVVRAILSDRINQETGAGITYRNPSDEAITIRTKSEAKLDVDQVRKLVQDDFAKRFQTAGDAIASAQVQAVQAVGTGAVGSTSFEIVTREASKEIVVGAIRKGLADSIQIEQGLEFKLEPNPALGGKSYFAVRSDNPKSLGITLNDADAREIDLQGWQGSVGIVITQVDPAQNIDAFAKRLRAMRLQPGFEQYGWRESKVFALSPADTTAPPPPAGLNNRFLVVVADENYPLTESEAAFDLWERNLAEKEVKLVQDALQRQKSLSQVTQFDKQVSGEAQVNAYLALILSWISIIVYVWFRFGNARWGLGAVIALVHDIIITTGMIVLTHHIADTSIGKFLMLDKFRIDLGMVAALLTIVGYSVNDTIIVYDRIRENRGRLTYINRAIINQSVSQTLSRTILTVVTVLMTVLVMYIFGGAGIHGMNYALLIGLSFGTYSSVAIASQLLLSRKEYKESAVQTQTA